MKRKILFSILLVLISWAFTSCEDMIQCKKCRLVSTDHNTGEISYDPNETEYCGTALAVIQATPAKTMGNVTTKYICR
ncbi:MAG: hypothetical protein GX876_01560 [Bacteroidales bacterium]|nr:hypothetical protein [Bacteroidales bacterium]